MLGHIYLLRSASMPELGVYIGSTMKPLSTRLSLHKASFKRWTSGKHNYVSSFSLFERAGDIEIALYEDYECEKRADLSRREGRIIKEHGEKCVNVNVAGRGLREYYDDNRASILQYGKDWYEMYGGREVKKAYYQQHREVFKARALARYYAKKEAAASLNA